MQFVGQVNDVFTMEEDLVDLVKGHCGPVGSGHSDQILSVASTALCHAPNISSHSLSRAEGFISLQDCCSLVF